MGILNLWRRSILAFTGRRCRAARPWRSTQSAILRLAYLRHRPLFFPLPHPSIHPSELSDFPKRYSTFVSMTRPSVVNTAEISSGLGHSLRVSSLPPTTTSPYLSVCMQPRRVRVDGSRAIRTITTMEFRALLQSVTTDGCCCHTGHELGRQSEE